MARGSLLTLDRGNSTLDAQLHGEPVRRQRLGPAECDLAGFLAGQLPSRCVGVSVVPGGLDLAAARLRHLGLQLLVVGVDLHCPLPLCYRTPATLGADRWLGALAAHRRFGASVVVDCGSATTVNLVDSDGAFRGGAIGPGLQALAMGMAAVTPHLPAADLDAAIELPPQSTATAVGTGVLLGYCGLVERLVGELQRALGEPSTVVLTGGNAAAYQRHGALAAQRVDDLVHQGLALLAEPS